MNLIEYAESITGRGKEAKLEGWDWQHIEAKSLSNEERKSHFENILTIECGEWDGKGEEMLLERRKIAAKLILNFLG